MRQVSSCSRLPTGCQFAMSLRVDRPMATPPLARPAHRRVAVRAVSMAGASRQRRLQNVPGDFFVDQRCIDCDTCRWMAPEVFAKVDGMSAVTQQPNSEEDIVKALQALLSCPTGSIRTEKPTNKILEVHKLFPLPVDEDTLPGVYHCGYHSVKSYGATSYLITHPEGNILVDSPSFKEKLAKNIDMLGGVRYMFLTHRDDVADHEMWAKRFSCERIMHSNDVEDSTAGVETKLYGDGPWRIGSDFEFIHTPGHTAGSVCLFYKPLKVLFTGDHLAKSEESDNLEISLMYNQQSVGLQLTNIKNLQNLNFLWILPGHGRRIKFRDNEEKNLAIESLLASHGHDSAPSVAII